jgi:hypothetical protein
MRPLLLALLLAASELHLLLNLSQRPIHGPCFGCHNSFCYMLGQQSAEGDLPMKLKLQDLPNNLWTKLLVRAVKQSLAG